MSVDDRLREAFAVPESDLEPLGTTLARVQQRARREILRDRLLALAAAASVVGVVLASLFDGGEPRSTEPAPPPPSPTITHQAEDLTGHWQSGKVTASDVAASLGRAGLAEWSDEVLADLPNEPWRFLLVIDRGEWRLWAEYAGGSELLDEGSMTIDQFEQVQVSPKSNPVARLNLDHSHRGVGGDRETIRWKFRGTTEPAIDGVPAEAFQRALYTTAAFVRTGR